MALRSSFGNHGGGIGLGKNPMDTIQSVFSHFAQQNQGQPMSIGDFFTGLLDEGIAQKTNSLEKKLGTLKTLFSLFGGG